MLLGGPLDPWQALLMSPKGRNASRDGFVNLNISLNSIASFGSLAPVGLALLFLFLAYKTLSIDRNHLKPAIYICTICTIYIHKHYILMVQIFRLFIVCLSPINNVLCFSQHFSLVHSCICDVTLFLLLRDCLPY